MSTAESCDFSRRKLSFDTQNAQLLDSEGWRSAPPSLLPPPMAKLGVPATNRASFYLYTVR
jgi:hypothetical protein